MRLVASSRCCSWSAVWLALSLCAVASAQGLSQFDKWVMQTSHSGVEATLHEDIVHSGFLLEYNFKAGAGFVIARHVFDAPVDLPENYEFTFDLSGSGPSNDLEVKLLDAPDGKGGKLGDSVWWIKRRNVEWPRLGTRINNKAKRFQFAWGPLNGAKIRKLGAIEIVVASSSGGAGLIQVKNARFAELPPAAAYTGRPVVTASSSRPDHPAQMALDDDPKTAWLDDEPAPPELNIDFGSSRELDALRIDWASPVSGFRISAADSPDGPWRELWRANDLAPVSRSYIDVPDTTFRMLRVYPSKVPGTSAGISDLRCLMRPETAGAENLGAWPLVAADLPADVMPRYFTGRQSTWTVLGSPKGTEETLINEEGDVELYHSGPMLSPVVLIDGAGGARSAERWSSSSQRMDLEGAPMAVVERTGGSTKLTVRAFCTEAEAFVLYTLNAGSNPVDGRLALCVRPFQVDPPWQFLNAPGGLARVGAIGSAKGELLINGSPRLALPAGWDRLAASTFDQGEAAAVLAMTGELPRAGNSATDPHGGASAAAVYSFSLAAGGQKSWLARVNLARDKIGPHAGEQEPSTDPALFEQSRAAEKRAWASLDGFSVHLPPGNEQLATSIKASLAYILINKDGPGFQPGSRSYERSWMRDGALTSAALLEFGLTDEVKQFIDWYAGYQFPDGGIPCVVDKRGADPVVENDSHGEFVYAVAEYYRYTHDVAFLTKHFDAVAKAVGHIEAERAKRQTAEYQGTGTRAEPGKRAVPLKAFYGLMPESISHEGYSSKPMHSYWDDFFTLKGLRDAVEIAGSLKDLARKEGQEDVAEQFARREAEWKGAVDHLAVSLRSSIESVRAAHGIDYIPGCVELGDFDATSTTIAINPCGAMKDLPREWFDSTFERWWNFFAARRDGLIDYVDYTPYEWRIVGSLVMMGQRERAWLATKWYMRDQNPARKEGDTSAGGWLHWAEIVHKDRGAGKWIGDMPHTWVASDFLRSIRTMFVYEEPSPSPALSSLVLFAGVPAEWADSPEGVSFTGLRTPYGALNASLKKKDGWYVMHYDGLAKMPYRVRLAPPVAWPPNEFEVLEGGGSQDDLPSGANGITTGMTVRFR